MGARQWGYVGSRTGKGPSVVEKAAIAAACERFIANVLKPRFLPEIRVTEFNYPIDISGKWRGPKSAVHPVVRDTWARARRHGCGQGFRRFRSHPGRLVRLSAYRQGPV